MLFKTNSKTVTAAALAVSVSASFALADDKARLAAGTSQQVTCECTTDATGGDGVRHACDSTPSIINAPPNHVFNQNNVRGGETSGNGDEHGCPLAFSKFVEVIPNTGLTQPTTATTTCHARGPSGHWAGRGWVSCTYVIDLVKYK